MKLGGPPPPGVIARLLEIGMTEPQIEMLLGDLRMMTRFLSLGFVVVKQKGEDRFGLISPRRMPEFAGVVWNPDKWPLADPPDCSQK